MAKGHDEQHGCALWYLSSLSGVELLPPFFHFPACFTSQFALYESSLLSKIRKRKRKRGEISPEIITFLYMYIYLYILQVPAHRERERDDGVCIL